MQRYSTGVKLIAYDTTSRQRLKDTASVANNQIKPDSYVLSPPSALHERVKGINTIFHGHIIKNQQAAKTRQEFNRRFVAINLRLHSSDSNDQAATKTILELEEQLAAARTTIYNLTQRLSERNAKRLDYKNGAQITTKKLSDFSSRIHDVENTSLAVIGPRETNSRFEVKEGLSCLL